MQEYSDVSQEYINQQYIKISRSVKRVRVLKNYTQEQLALSMGFSTATFYTNAENNKRGKHFSIEHLIKIAKILDVNISVFFIP
jgi:transcriptional regulator with XRE-family HTH domain